MSLSGIQRGQGWRALPNTLCGDLPAIVRYLALDRVRNEYRLLGSGAVIGVIEGRWLVTATAAALFEGVALGAPAPGSSSGLERRYRAEALQDLRCALTVPERNGELLCQPVGAVISARVSQRDTALVFVSFPEALPVNVLPIDLGPPPAPAETLLVAGFAATPAVRAGATDAGDVPAVPARQLLVREGFFADFGTTTGRLHYPLFRHLIPLEPTMMGGPVILQREVQRGQALRTLAAINSQDVPQVSGDAAAQPQREGEGFATHALALYGHEVLLPSGTWIPFLEAVRRGVVSSAGREALRVAQRGGEQGLRQYYIEP
jgi:hypothetical protein